MIPTLGVWENIEDFSVVDSLLVALLAILIVFLALTVIILISTAIQKAMSKIEAKTNILPREENKLLNEDEDAVVAALVATIDFYKETKKDARLISIKKIED
mgnify:CR=1 FL=1